MKRFERSMIIAALSISLLECGGGSPFEPDLAPLYPQMKDFYLAEAKKDFESVHAFIDPDQHSADAMKYHMEEIRNRRNELGTAELLGCGFSVAHKYHSRGRRVDAQCFVIRKDTVYREYYVLYAAYPSRDRKMYPLPFYISQVHEIETAGYQGQVARDEYGSMTPLIVKD